MEQYINKSALVTEIESKIEKYTKRGEESDAKRDGYGMYWGGVLSCLNELRTLCDTIKVKDFWKDAQGDDLPEIDREVIALLENGKVVFAHRPPERWYGRNLDGEEHVFEPKTYDKGEWNIPNVVWWLDLDLPIKGE